MNKIKQLLTILLFVVSCTSTKQKYGVLGIVVHKVALQYSHPRFIDDPDTFGVTRHPTLVRNLQAQPTLSPITLTINGSSANQTLPAPASLTFKANTADFGTVSFLSNGTVVAQATSPYNATWSNVPAGTYVIQAKIKIRNRTGYSNQITITVTGVTPPPPPPPPPPPTGNIPPTVSITSPTNNSSFPAGTSINVTTTSGDADGTVTNVDLFANGVSQPHGSTQGTFILNLPAATYSLVAKATDNTGAVTSSTAVSVFVTAVTNLPPVVTVSSPSLVYTAPAYFDFNVQASDADGIKNISIYINGVFAGGAVGTSITFNVSEPAGTYVMYATATDNTGLKSQSNSITITVNGTGNLAPTVSITAPPNNSSYVQGTAFNVLTTSADADGTVTNVDLFANNVSQAHSVPAGTFSLNLAVGVYTLVAKATDNAGAITSSAPITVTVTSIPPPPGNIAPTISITYPSNNSSFVERTTFSVTTTSADADGTVANVDLFINGINQTHSTTPGSFNANLAIGTYTLVAKATDNVGAVTASAPITVNITATPPLPPPPPINGLTYDACVLVNFDGGTYTGSSWNVTTYANSGMTTAEQDDVLQSVNNDWSFTRTLFTRSVTVWNTYSKKFQCNVTSTYAWYPNAGGVSYVGYFGNPGEVNWVFSPLLQYSTKLVAEAVSHECGHECGLQHSHDWGTNCSNIATYYAGIGTGNIGFAPIMGNSYYKILSLYDDGEPFAPSCALAVIDQVATLISYAGQRADDYYNDLTITPNNPFPVTGIIERRGDIDVLAVPAGTISVQPFTNDKGEDPDLHLTVNYYNSSKVLVSTNTSETYLGVTFASTGGFIAVTTRSNQYHSTYGMLGKYVVTLSSLAGPPVFLGDNLTHEVPQGNDVMEKKHK